MQKVKQLKKLCLRGRYGAGVESIFSSDIAKPTLETVDKLKKLHPEENFVCPKPNICEFWTNNPINASEVLALIKKLPNGKAAGPSGISFDILKTACNKTPEIADELAFYFQQLVSLKVVPPPELTAARLIALVKAGSDTKPSGIRPIAVGESLSRLFASIIFNRIVKKAGKFLSPMQFGIQTINGASVAALTSDLFFNLKENNSIFKLDFSNAFNSVRRKAIYEVIQKHFPELSSYFYLFYGKPSDLVYDVFFLKSSSGVKQGDPLGPLLFCIAIQESLIVINEKYPFLKIVVYMDDISLIDPFSVVQKASNEIAEQYEIIGLHLNPKKCLSIGNDFKEYKINNCKIPFTNYSHEAFRFLGYWLRNVDEITKNLNEVVAKLCNELPLISELEIEIHIKFFILKILPSLSIDFCRSFNQLRATFFASSQEVNPELIRAQLFSSSQFGGVGFTKSSILCQAAFVGGGKNFIFEFVNRFPEDIHLLSPSFSKYLFDLDVAINKIAPQIWCQCFPDSVQEIPPRNLVNLRYCVKKLQQKLTVTFEGLDYEVRLGMAKHKNPAFANFLLNVRDSSASCLINQVPRIYGLFLNHPCLLLSMRLRSFIWPDNLPHGLICKCGKSVTPAHLFNCNRFITFRSKVHHAVRDQLYCMFKSYKFESFLEPLLSNLADESDRNFFWSQPW
ncbi:hypothetical protein P9112_005788 [Eukaryota sp. TZLM1-RC]